MLAQTTVKALAASIADLPNLVPAQADAVLASYKATAELDGVLEDDLIQRLIKAGCLRNLLKQVAKRLEQPHSAATPLIALDQVCTMLKQLCSAKYMRKFADGGLDMDWDIVPKLLQLAMAPDSSKAKAATAESILGALLHSTSAASDLIRDLHHNPELLDRVLTYQGGRLMLITASYPAMASQILDHGSHILLPMLLRRNTAVLSAIADSARHVSCSIWSLTNESVLQALVSDHSCCPDLFLKLFERPEGVNAIVQQGHLAAVVAIAQDLAADTAIRDRSTGILIKLVKHSTAVAAYLVQQHMPLIKTQLQQWGAASSSNFLRQLFVHPQAAEAVLQEVSIQSLGKQLMCQLTSSGASPVNNSVQNAVRLFLQLLENATAATQLVRGDQAAEGAFSVTSLLRCLPNAAQGSDFPAKWHEKHPVLRILQALMKHKAGFQAVAMQENVQTLLDFMLKAPQSSQVAWWQLLDGLVQDKQVALMMHQSGMREQLAGKMVQAADQGITVYSYRQQILKAIDKHQQKKIAAEQREQREQQLWQQYEQQRQQLVEERDSRAAKRAKQNAYGPPGPSTLGTASYGPSSSSAAAAAAAAAAGETTRRGLTQSTVKRLEKKTVLSVTEDKPCSLAAQSSQRLSCLISRDVLPDLIKHHKCFPDFFTTVLKEREGVRAIIEQNQLAAVVAVAQTAVGSVDEPHEGWGMSILTSLVRYSHEAAVYLVKHHMPLIQNQLQQSLSRAEKATCSSSEFLAHLFVHSQVFEAVQQEVISCAQPALRAEAGA